MMLQLADDSVIALAILATGGGELFHLIDAHQSFDENIYKLHKESEFLHRNNQRFKFLTQTALHELRRLPIHQLAFGGVGAAFSFGRFDGNFIEFLAAIRADAGRFARIVFIGAASFGDRHNARAFRIRIFERPFQRAMHDQIGIAANRRGEMRVFVEG